LGQCDLLIPLGEQLGTPQLRGISHALLLGRDQFQTIQNTHDLDKVRGE
jgi:hypothetical protein